MSHPYFSIIIPALNEERFLPQLLASLAEQSERDFEVIVVDGKSTDKTVQKANTFQKKLPKLQVVVSDVPNLPRQRNLGAKQAHGTWLLFVDSDSIFHPYALSRLKMLLEKDTCKHITPWFTPDSANGSDALLTLLINGSIEAGLLMRRQFAPGPFSGIKRDVFTLVGGYNESLAFGEDSDISRRIHEAGYPLKIIRETLVVYSLRRFRKQGSIKMMQFYARVAFQFLLTKRTPTDIPGYLMGGHVYKQEDIKKSQNILKELRTRLKKITDELF